MTSERTRDRWEVRACESCGFERSVKVSYLYGPDQPSWDKDCDVCQARWRLRKVQRRVEAAENFLHKMLAKRAKEVERRKKKPIDRTPREVLIHIRFALGDMDGDGKASAWCRRRGNSLKFDDPDKANCARCRKAHAKAQEKPDAPSDHLLP